MFGFLAFQYLAKLLLSFCTSGCTTLSATRAQLYRFGQLGALHLCFWADLHPTVPLYQLTPARLYRFGQLCALYLCFWADLSPAVPLYQLTRARMYRFLISGRMIPRLFNFSAFDCTVF